MEPHDLYGLPLEQFTERRNALARELRRDGRRDEAATVSKLRKPSVAAWAVNQLVRTQRREVDALFSAGDALAQAQADLLANSGEASALRKAVDAERAAVELLTDKARGLLNADGHELTQARLEQVAETLHAAALDEDARIDVEGGCLERELRHIGLGPAGPAAPRSGSRKKARSGSRAEKAGAARPSKTQAARRAEAAARRQLERASRELRAAQSRRERVAEELRDADAAVDAARERVAEAKQAAQQD
jgi:hypothetical protein